MSFIRIQEPVVKFLILEWNLYSFDRAIMMGLMLHTNAKQLIKKQNYKDALEVLTMGEVSFWAAWYIL